jgi:hypothetical protein
MEDDWRLVEEAVLKNVVELNREHKRVGPFSYVLIIVL